MISLIKDNKVKEFGDFQTPKELAFEICRLLSKSGVQAESVVEPNCGLGSFVQAAGKIFFSSEIFGFDISPKYVEFARNKFTDDKNISISQANFFETDWKKLFDSLPKPILILGNPPWVTNSQLSVLESKNLPQKENFQNFGGFEAMTGKSNFDISEWMLIRLLESLNAQNAFLAMLCKTSVARKVLKYAWKNEIHLAKSAIYRIETEKYFNASVDACLLFCEFSDSVQNPTSKVFDSLEAGKYCGKIGFKNNELIASIDLYERWKYLNGSSPIKWRSGIKHDCSKVMELTKVGDGYKNSFGEIFELEDEFVYPMLKSSDIANGNLTPRRWMLVTQKQVKSDTLNIAEIAPQTWNYLISNGEFLDKRGSSIYKKRARFAIFGIGDYSFSPWKVAISGFYKKLEFNVVGSCENKPIVLDDTCYFLPCETEKEANKICSLLNSKVGREFFEAFIFWDAKRPITIEILQKLNLEKLEKFSKTNVRKGWDEAFRTMTENYEKELIGVDVQNSFDFEEWQ
ncbi:MAG TPA: N-6 DNA methylase [Pyrinomonadaceae bacterium]|nr:N-6 DNA methylase [Pyrinomonadaceae bacterium]